MRRFITIGITKTGQVDVLQGADKGYSHHRDEFRKLDAGKKKTKAFPYAEVQVVDLSKGIKKRRRFGSIRVKGMDESGKRTVARTIKPRRAAKKTARKPAPKTAKRETPGSRRMKSLTSEKAETAKPNSSTAKPAADAKPPGSTA